MILLRLGATQVDAVSQGEVALAVASVKMEGYKYSNALYPHGRRENALGVKVFSGMFLSR